LRELVEIDTRDGVLLRGELEEAGPVWLILAHDLGADLDLWRPLSLVGSGVSVLAVDLRGHGGSDGKVDPALSARDLADVSTFARHHGGEATVIGVAGTLVQPALDAAAETTAFGIVAISPLAEAVDGRSLPKLVIIAGQNQRQAAASMALRRSSGSAIVVNLPIAGGCAELISGAWRTNVEAYMLAFLRDATRPASGISS
jgi:hypothetical protein